MDHLDDERIKSKMLTFVMPMERFSVALIEKTNTKGIDWFSLTVSMNNYSCLTHSKQAYVLSIPYWLSQTLTTWQVTISAITITFQVDFSHLPPRYFGKQIVGIGWKSSPRKPNLKVCHVEILSELTCLGCRYSSSRKRQSDGTKSNDLCSKTMSSLLRRALSAEHCNTSRLCIHTHSTEHKNENNITIKHGIGFKQILEL